MSDGPHRSLPLRKGWKKVAEWADNSIYDCSQVAECIEQAVLQDFRQEISDEVIALLKAEFNDRETDLFPEHRRQVLAEIGEMLDGFPLGHALFDCVEQRIAAGEDGQQGFMNAIESVVRDRMVRAERQIEEHYQRHHDSSMERAANVRERVEGAIKYVSVSDVAGIILGQRKAKPMRAKKRSGLDDGVPLQ